MVITREKAKKKPRGDGEFCNPLGMRMFATIPPRY